LAIFYVSFNLVLHAAHDSLVSQPNPAADYAQAITRFQQIQQSEGLSLATFAGALERPPRVQDVILVTSQGDEAVNDVITWQLMGLWRSKGLHELTCVDFPKRDESPARHD
jgi:hypothetical protein